MRAHPGEEGVSTIEYALLASLIAMVIIIVVISLGDNVSSLYNDIADNVTDRAGK